MNYQPPRPTGSNRFQRYAQWVWDSIVHNRIQDSSTVKVDRLTNGIRLNVKQAPGGGAPSVPTNAYHFKQSLGDYFLTTEGVAIAKPYRLRNSIAGESIYNIAIAFTYPHNPALGGPSADILAYVYQHRSIASLGLSENCGVNPPYVVGSLIYACAMPVGDSVMSDPKDTVTSIGGIPVALQWLQYDTAQAWCKFSDQTFGT